MEATLEPSLAHRYFKVCLAPHAAGGTLTAARSTAAAGQIGSISRLLLNMTAASHGSPTCEYNPANCWSLIDVQRRVTTFHLVFFVFGSADCLVSHGNIIFNKSYFQNMSTD